MGSGRPLGSIDELLSMSILSVFWWMRMIADMLLVLLSGSTARDCWMLGLNRPIRDRRRSGRLNGGLWQS